MQKVLNFFSFRKGQKYYLSSGRKIVDFSLGAIFGFMFLGVALWHAANLMLLFILVTLGLTYIVFYLGRKWIGIGAIFGTYLTYAFAYIVSNLF